MFIHNKYNIIYFSIVNKAKSTLLLEGEYYEKHHIIPKSLGGSNDDTNIVKLTAREHYVCHLLLPKFTEGHNKIKMLHAAWRMMCRDKKSNRTYKVTSRMYQSIKEQRAIYLRTLVGNKNPNFGKKTGRTSNDFTIEWRQNLSISKKGKTTWNKGIARTDEVKAKMSATRKLKSADPTWNVRPPCSKEKADKISNALTGKKWINNGIIRKYVGQHEFKILIENGWKPGLKLTCVF